MQALVPIRLRLCGPRLIELVLPTHPNLPRPSQSAVSGSIQTIYDNTVDADELQALDQFIDNEASD